MATGAGTEIEAIERDIQTAQMVFEEITGIRGVAIRPRESGLEVFYDVIVGAKAPVYIRALSEIDRRLPEDSDLRGALLLAEEADQPGIKSLEARALGALIRRSLSVGRDELEHPATDERVEFPERQELKVLEPVPHLIWGRRGVGKSSLILVSCRTLLQRGNPIAWVGAEPYSRRNDALAFVQMLEDITTDLVNTASQLSVDVVGLHQVQDTLTSLDTDAVTFEGIAHTIPVLKRQFRAWRGETGRNAYVFIDDSHMLGSRLQPFTYRQLLDLFSDSGVIANAAGVRTQMTLSDSDRGISVQVPHDYQHVPLDLTLQDPATAKEHLERVLAKFLQQCGIPRIGSIVRKEAIERLVWCSGGVPRDFLVLIDWAMEHALRRHRTRIGKEDVNLATGELADQKLVALKNEASTEDADVLQGVLERLQAEVLDKHRTNCFLVRKETNRTGYKNVQKLADLRLIHLLHASITPGEAGDKHEAYLLDYSFYTGVRRRHRLEELEIDPDAPPKYSVLRDRPQIDLALFE